MSDERAIPTGRLGRLARLAQLGVRTGASLLVDPSGEGAAARASEVLGTLRGLSAKVGQMASYVDGIVPEAQRDAYEGALAGLRAAAPRSPFSAVAATLEEELGAPLASHFASFDEVPIASASIGQVHRARLVDGRAVAVKVQHPGIREALESDLANGSLLENVAGALGGRRFDTKSLFAVVRTRFREELDYSLEAERLAFFRRFHAGDPRVFVPAVITSHSTPRVLTTELVRGLAFEEACAAPEADRRGWAETLWRFVFRGNLQAGVFNADPHPGNYFFQDDGRVAFIDFGCCQVIPEPRRARARAVHAAAIAGDEAAFDAAVSAMIDARPGPLEALARRYTRRCFEPVFASPYRITRDYAASLVRDFRTMGLEARQVEEAAFFTMPPEMLFMNRLQFGFYSVLARLDVAVDYAEVERAFVDADPTGGGPRLVR